MKIFYPNKNTKPEIYELKDLLNKIEEISRDLNELKTKLKEKQPEKPKLTKYDIWLTREQASELTGLTPETISNWVSEGNIERRPHGLKKYNRASIERYMHTGIPQAPKKTG